MNRATSLRRPYPTLGRRRFLWSALSGLVLATPLARAGSRLVPYRAPDWLPLVVADPDAAASLGRTYLDQHPDSRDPEALVRELERAARSEFASAEPARIAETLRALVLREFAEGKVVAVKGWTLSRTEARLYGLASLG